MKLFFTFRKRLSNLFKSFSDKKDSAKNSGGGGSASGSLTGRIRRSLFKENSTENETIEIVQVIMNHRIIGQRDLRTNFPTWICSFRPFGQLLKIFFNFAKVLSFSTRFCIVVLGIAFFLMLHYFFHSLIAAYNSRHDEKCFPSYVFIR